MTTMRSKFTVAVFVLAATFAVGAGRTALNAQAAKTTWDGIYTAEQATRGKATAIKACGACHGATLAGGDLAPTLSGADFIGHWYDAKLGELAGKVSQTMPADAPGSMKPEEYADILAFMLEANGYPAGTETLKLEPAAALDAIKLTKTK